MAWCQVATGNLEKHQKSMLPKRHTRSHCRQRQPGMDSLYDRSQASSLAETVLHLVHESAAY